MMSASAALRGAVWRQGLARAGKRPAAAAAAGSMPAAVLLGSSHRPCAFAANMQRRASFSSQPRVDPNVVPPPQPASTPLPPLRRPLPPAPSTPAVQPPHEAVAAASPSAVAVGESRRMPVMAFYVGQKIDLIPVVQQLFLSHKGYKISDDVLLVPLSRDPKDKECVRSAVVVFKHGSVVFFNVDEAVQTKYLHSIMRHCGEVVPQSHRFREELECRLRPWQDKYHEMGQDLINLRELTEDSVKVISDVIGHSVALNFYNQKADRMLEDFRVLNNSVEGSGIFTEMDKKSLFKLVAMNNKILTDAMSSGLLEQTKPAWNFNRLDALWNDLRHEFSIGDRFAKVEHKINHVQSNTKFFLEILNHQKSNKLEWIIIILIAAEIVLSVIDLYHQIFEINLGGGDVEIKDPPSP